MCFLQGYVGWVKIQQVHYTSPSCKVADLLPLQSKAGGRPACSAWYMSIPSQVSTRTVGARRHCPVELFWMQ